MAKIEMLVTDETEKTVSLTPKILQEDGNATPALLVSASIIALFNAGLLMQLGYYMLDNPGKPVRDFFNDNTNT